MSEIKTRYRHFLLNGWAVSSLVLGSFMTLGCGDSATSQTPSQPGQPQTNSAESEPDLVATAPFQQKLIGVWLGEAFLDEARLLQKLQSLPVQQQETTLQLAEEFLSTAIAFDFRSDGSLETDIEITRLDSQPIRDGGAGNWRVLETSSDAALVETTTQLADGSTVTDQRQYHFGADSNRVVIMVDLGVELDGCGPAIVLRRQLVADNVADLNIAERTGNALVK